MEDGRRSREWLHQASFAAGSMGYEGEGAHKDKYGHGGGLDGFLKPKQNGELRAAEIQSFNQRGGATVKFDTEKLDGYITKILSENEMLKNQNLKLDNELSKLLQKVRDLEGVEKHRNQLAMSVQDRTRSRLNEFKRLEDQNNRMSKELRINKELSIQLNKSNLRQSGSSFVTLLKPVSESQTTYQNNRRALSKDHESLENIFLESNLQQAAKYTAGTDDLVENTWDSHDPIQIEDTPADEYSDYYQPKYSQSDLMSNRKRLFDNSEVSELETHKKLRPIGAITESNNYNQNYSMQIGSKSSPIDKKKQHAISYHADHQSNAEQDLCNFQSFSKQYVTFDKNGHLEENKENSGSHSGYHQIQKVPSRKQLPNQQRVTKGTYADRYMHMMKNKRDSSISRQPTPDKNSKKQSMFDEIRQQAVSKVQKRYN